MSYTESIESNGNTRVTVMVVDECDSCEVKEPGDWVEFTDLANRRWVFCGSCFHSGSAMSTVRTFAENLRTIA